MQVQSSESPWQSAVLSPRGLPPGTRVGRWRVERRLGGGGNGTVYEVRLRPGGRSHALKLAHAPEDPRFARESESLRLVRHPGVVRLVEEGVWQAGPMHYPFLVMEYVRGESLYDWALARNPTARQVAGLLGQVADALAEAHRRGVLHRDFKGENTRVAEDGRLVVLDWGAGWHPGASTLTSASGLPPGTAPYHSPQALLFMVRVQRGRDTRPYHYSVADELYAVGGTFYRLLVEQYPPLRLSEAPGESLEEPGPWAVRALNPRVPEALAALVQRLLAFQPEARPRSARAFAEAVRLALAEAGPAWDEPLFEWYAGPAQDTRTTSTGAAPGPVAPGQEVALRHARTQHLDRVQQHREARRVRRRELDRVITVPGLQAGTHSGPRRGLRARRLTVFLVALVAATGLGWALARWSLPTRSTPLAAATRSRQLARPTGPTDTAAPAAALPFLPNVPPWPEAAMSMFEPRPSSPSLLGRYLLAASAAATLSACPATQVVPDSARCPSEALETMRQLRLSPGDDFFVTLDINNPEGSEATEYDVPVSDGPITSRFERFSGTSSAGKLPEGTLLHGRLWTGGEQVIGRYTRATTPDGSEYPVCIILANEDGQLKSPGSRPGYTLLRPTPFVTVVDRFP